MKQLTFIVSILLLVSCGKDKVVLLPEIQHTKITKMYDVSPAYLFYDETQADSIELNRKNLIGTTNWLVNVDKRLRLEQAIPKIKFLQDKKRNAQMHKNENAKNYFTCNDTSIQNLGFIEFTDIIYQTQSVIDYFQKQEEINDVLILRVESLNEIGVGEEFRHDTIPRVYENINDAIIDAIEESKRNKELEIYLSFNKKLAFQDYITFKSELLKMVSDEMHISKNEFIN